MRKKKKIKKISTGKSSLRDVKISYGSDLKPGKHLCRQRDPDFTSPIQEVRESSWQAENYFSPRL